MTTTNTATHTPVSRPGTVVDRPLRDAMPARPDAADRDNLHRAIQSVERAERAADERGDAIRVH